MVLAIPSNASDNVYCILLAHSAILVDMAGYTGFTVGPVNGKHAYIPIMWCSCLSVSVQTCNLELNISCGRKTEQGGDKDSVINQSAKLLGSKRYQQKQNRGIIRDQTKQALNFEIFGWDFPSRFYCELI